MIGIQSLFGSKTGRDFGPFKTTEKPQKKGKEPTKKLWAEMCEVIIENVNIFVN
jgi:nucleoid DNA-binding protein